MAPAKTTKKKTTGTAAKKAPKKGTGKALNIGFGNIVSAARIVAIVSPNSAPINRLISEARDNGTLINASYGRKTRAVIRMDSGDVVTSAIQPDTLADRWNALGD